MMTQKERKLQATREWKKKNKERHAELARAYRRRNPEKTKAQNQLNYAVRMGRIERQSCETCGSDEKIHAHHHDYSKPYDVRWLCFLCHKNEHPAPDGGRVIKVGDYKPARLYGSDNPNASLGVKEVREVRKMLELGISQEKIAKALDVHQGTISKIKLGKRYKNVT